MRPQKSSLPVAESLASLLHHPFSVAADVLVVLLPVLEGKSTKGEAGKPGQGA
ncbi:MAG: hypothetical protein ACR2HJ_12520 [Fimbriimonadales bacterium]